MGILNKLGYLLSAAIGGGFTSQFPGFLSHYVQRLGGRMSEAYDNALSWAPDAHTKTTSIDELLTACTNAAEELVRRKCPANIERYYDLREAYDMITSAKPWERPLAFLRTFDTETFMGTLHDYVPNIPVNKEGIIYAAIGAVVGITCYALGRTAFITPQKKTRTSNA